jgi:GTPase involved in cell partitioning and DNA repair
MLKNELKKHNSDLVNRESLLLITKTDLIPLELLDIGKLSEEIKCILISSVTGDNLNVAIRSIAELIQSQED